MVQVCPPSVECATGIPSEKLKLLSKLKSSQAKYRLPLPGPAVIASLSANSKTVFVGRGRDVAPVHVLPPSVDFETPMSSSPVGPSMVRVEKYMLPALSAVSHGSPTLTLPPSLVSAPPSVNVWPPSDEYE